jgi:hypothetical protein
MKWSSLVLGFLLAVSPSDAADKPVITEDLVRKSIAVFRQDPTSDLARTARALVVKFSRDSPDILIAFNQKNYPISELTAASEEEQSTLLAAFIVGNVDSQLSRGSKAKAKDDPYAGDLQLIRTYRQLQQRNRKLTLPAIEKMSEMERRGELKHYLSSK